MKGLRVTKCIKKKKKKRIKFEGVCYALKSKKSLQRQSVTKYLRLQVSCEIEYYEKSLSAIFLNFFASINKSFILAGIMRTRISFYEV